MLQYILKKSFHISIKMIQEDLRRLGLVCIGVGCAGIFLGIYPGYEKDYFVGITLVGLLSWLFGIIEENQDEHNS